MTDLISTREAATVLGVSEGTVQRWVATGRLVPAAKVPGRTGAFLFAREHIAAYVAERHTAATRRSDAATSAA